MDILSWGFLFALGQIIWINILLSGDNAVVIALACRSLPPRQMKIGIFLGSGAAILLRIIFTIFIVYLMGIPWLKVAGALLLLWIAVKLLVSEEGEEHAIEARASIWGAVQTIAIADAVMSLDNVIAIASAADSYPEAKYVLLILGLVISIPLIIAGSALVLKLLKTFPILVWAGAALLGWIAGNIAAEDPAVSHWVEETIPGGKYVLGAIGVVFVLVVGKVMHMRVRARNLAELAADPPPPIAPPQ